MHVKLPYTVTGPAICKVVAAECFFVGSMPLTQTYVGKGETVTLEGTGTVAVVAIPAEHAVEGESFEFEQG